MRTTTRWPWSWWVAMAAKPGWRRGWPYPVTPRHPPAASRRRLIRSPLSRSFPLIPGRFCWSAHCKTRPGGELKFAARRVTDMPRKHRVVDHIVERIAAIGVHHIFGVDGANIEDLYDAAYFNSSITAVLAKHEFSATTMADGYSRSGAGLGVVAACYGGGALNLVAGLGESLGRRGPVLALVGQPATTMDGQGSFQDTSGRNGSLNAEALFSQTSVFCRRVRNAAEIVSVLPAAIAAAHTGGPAVLLLPKDIQQSVISRRCSLDVGRHRSGGDPHPIVRALRRVQGPVTIIAGEQVARDDARAELAELRGVLRARGACVPDAQDV